MMRDHQIVHLYGIGCRVADIATMMSLSRARVWEILRDHGVRCGPAWRPTPMRSIAQKARYERKRG